MLHHRTTLLLALLLTVTACGPGASSEADPPLTEEQFIQTFIALRQADYAAVSPEEFQAMRDSIFESHGTSADELRAFVASWSRDVQRMSETWDTIEARLRRQADEMMRIGRDRPGD